MRAVSYTHLDVYKRQEIYQDYSDEDITFFYSAKEEREDSLQFIRENNKAPLAQVFTAVSYTHLSLAE